MAAKTRKKPTFDDKPVKSGQAVDVGTQTSWQPMTISQTGKAPKNRFQDAASLFSVYQQAQLEALQNDERLTDLRANYDGLPMDLGDISNEQTQNNGNLPNINRREFTRMIDDYAGNFVAIDTGADTVAEIGLKWKYVQSAAQKTQWEQALGTFFTEAFKEWNVTKEAANGNSFCPTSLAQYVMESSVRNTQMGLFNIGVSFFRDNIDWRWIAVPTRCVIVPNGTKITLRNNSIVYVRRTYTSTELYGKAKKVGWNTKEIYRVLYERLSENLPGSISRVPYSDVENWVRNNESLLQRDFRQIFLVECFVEEFPDADGNAGGVTKYVISDQGPNRQFLYKGDREYDSIHNVLIAFTDNPGPEGDWHGVKGYGDQLYDIATQNNLLWNHFVTMAILTSTPMFQSATSDDRQKLSQMVWSRMGVLLPGLTLTQVKIDADLEQVGAAMDSGVELLQDTARNYPQQQTQPNSNVTATEATLRAQKEAQLSTRQIMMYRSIGLDPLFSEMYRRITNQDYPVSWPGGVAAKNFRDKCKAFGIPVEAYVDAQNVQASRRGGTGNASLDTQRAMQVLSVASPGRGQQEAKKAIIASLAGWDQVPTFYQDVPAQDSDDVTMTLEKSILTLGQLPDAISFQNHQKHLGTPDPAGPGHLSILATAHQAAMQMLAQGLKTALPDAQKLSRVMDATVHHCGEHMQYLGQQLQFTRDKALENAVKQLGSVLGTFGKFAQSFDQALAKASQEAQPQAPQMSAEDQIKMDRWNTEKQIMLDRAQTESNLYQQSQNQKLGSKAEDHAVKIQFDKEKQLQKLGAMGESTLLENRINAVQGAVDSAGQITQNMQAVSQNAQQHQQAMQQSDDQHQQGMAQTRAAHNQKLVQQAQDQEQQQSQDDQGPTPGSQ